MNKFIKSIIIICRSKFIKIFIILIENFLIKLLYLKKSRLYSNFLSIFQLFSSGKIYSHFRKRKYFFYKKCNKEKFSYYKIINDIHNNSFSFLGNILSDEVVKSQKYFFEQKKIYNSHVSAGSEGGELISLQEFNNNQDCNYGSFNIKTSINCEQIVSAIKNFNMKKIAQEYLLTENVKIYSINTMLTKKSKIYSGVCNLHRDMDSMSSLTFFIYWTDVTKLNGSTIIYPGSHFFNLDKHFSSYAENSSNLIHLEGSKGSVYAVDTWAWHSGNKKIITDRLVTWVRYTACPANTYFTDENFFYKSELEALR